MMVSRTVDVGRLPRTISLEAASEDGRFRLRFVDQRALPEQLVFEETYDWRSVVDAIKSLAVRGAPAIGVAGAASLALWAQGSCGVVDGFDARAAQAASVIADARPTAVNLKWGTMRALDELRRARANGAAPCDVPLLLYRFVKRMEERDEAVNRAIGKAGAALLEPGSRVLTHCNAGSLATVFFGTALGVVYAGAEEGKVERVYADETRPVCQGSRLTVWELSRAGVPATLVCDDMAASLMARGSVDAVVVGADRIAANGDAANKIGTYGVAVLARHHGVPFYVAAPSSTFDPACLSGADIPIEQRSPSEVASFVPEGIDVWNPAFDVTPASLITAIVTEFGAFAPQEASAAVASAQGDAPAYAI